MFNTYLNDNLTVPYPFFGDIALPFACSCIAGLGICVQSEQLPGPLYAASITIGRSSVYMVISYTENNTEKILGTLFADSDRSERTGLLTPVDGEKQAAGFLILGTIPETSIGQYNGKYNLDPSCVTYMPTNRYGYYKEVQLQGTRYPIGQTLSIDCNGLLAITGGTIHGTEESDTQDLFAFTERVGYDTRVTDINGIDTLFDGTTGTLVLSGGSSIDVAVQQGFGAYQDNDSVMVVSINGGTAFPNCYETEDDASQAAPVVLQGASE